MALFLAAQVPSFKRMNPEVTLYTTNYCGYCTAAKRLLDQLGVGYNEIDVTDDKALRDEVSKAFDGYTTVPMIVVDGRFIGGYRELAALARRQALTS